MTVRYIVGDVFDALASIEDGSVDMVMTSPPFLALRSYLPADHPDKAKEIGSEPTPAAFLDTLLALTAEWRRVLAPHGSICVELGDTYAGSGGSGGDYNEGGLREGQEKFRQSRRHLTTTSTRYADHLPLSVNGGDGWPMKKSLCGIPTLYAWSLAYSRNLLTGKESPAGPWRIRNLVTWCRPNPPVGDLGDKFRPATSYLTVATLARDRYFDLDSVRTVAADQRFRTTNGAKKGDPVEVQTANYQQRVPSNPAGAPPLDWWEIPTQPYKGSHYATFPEALCVRPIKTMCPERVCRTCGLPSRRIVDANRVGEKDDATRAKLGGPLSRSLDRPPEKGWEYERTTLGWTDCGHDDWRPGVVLDPFAGSGTTLVVAAGHGRDALGIDIDERNADLARDRLGWLLSDVEHTSTEPAA